MADVSKKSLSSPGGTFGMEKMKQKDAEARLERMNTKQRRGTPTVRIFLTVSNVQVHLPYILYLQWQVL